MEFYEITEEAYPHPGEYIFHEPSQSIVLCGAYTGTHIKALHNGRVLKDKAENFKKIKIGTKERKEKFVSKCKAGGK